MSAEILRASRSREISSDASGATELAPFVQQNESLVRLRRLIELFMQTPHSMSGFTLSRPSDYQKIVGQLRALMEQNRVSFQRKDEEFVDLFFDCVTRLEKTLIRIYPNESLRLSLLRAEALLECNEAAQVVEIVGPIARRPYLVEGELQMLQNALALHQRALLMNGRPIDVAEIAWRDLELISRIAPLQAGAAFRAFVPALHLTSAARGGAGTLSGCLAFLARSRVALGRESGSRIMGRMRRVSRACVDRCASAIATISALVAQRSRMLGAHEGARDPEMAERVLVTRAMGGVGDLIMMTPGLHALARRRGQPVHLGIKNSFFPIFSGNPDVVLHDIDSELEPWRYGRWYNLSFCPSGLYESRHRPNVRKARIELFAKGMGISIKELKEVGLKPRLFLTDDSLRMADEFMAEHRLTSDGCSVVGVQPFSRDTYKDYQRMDKVILELAKKFKVMIFHHVSVRIPTNPNIIQVFGRPLTEVMAILTKCNVLVCVDSALLHAAAAFDIPTVALFGPIDGNRGTKFYPQARVVSARKGFRCMPCWRNEDTPCHLTGGQESACLTAIDEREVVALVDDILRSVPASTTNATPSAR
jgi:hypothetical protein